MLVLDRIKKSYGSHLVLDSVSLNVEQGEIVCLHGPSGIGKTTILDIIAGLESYEGGTRKVDVQKIGYAFQDNRLIPWICVLDNLELVLKPSYGAVECRHRAMGWLERLGLIEYSDKLCLELSGGMERRLNIARSLAIEPELLLLDEPLAFQDKGYRSKLLCLFKELNQDRATTIVVVEHLPEAASELESRMVSLKEQPIVLEV
jgi:NitT/TauT family transport system ATP-binding protein